MHDANDVRVKQEQADLMVAALRKSGGEVTYLVSPNAGHMGGGVPLSIRKRWAAIDASLAEQLDDILDRIRRIERHRTRLPSPGAVHWEDEQTVVILRIAREQDTVTR